MLNKRLRKTIKVYRMPRHSPMGYLINRSIFCGLLSIQIYNKNKVRKDKRFNNRTEKELTEIRASQIRKYVQQKENFAGINGTFELIHQTRESAKNLKPWHISTNTEKVSECQPMDFNGWPYNNRNTTPNWDINDKFTILTGHASETTLVFDEFKTGLEVCLSDCFFCKFKRWIKSKFKKLTSCK